MLDRARSFALLLPLALAACASPPGPGPPPGVASYLTITSPQAKQRITSNTAVVAFLHWGYTDLRCRAAAQTEVEARSIDGASGTCTVDFGPLVNGPVDVFVSGGSTAAGTGYAERTSTKVTVFLDRGAPTGGAP